MKRPAKLICVIGLGQFGSELARELAKSAEVIAMDNDEIRVNSIVDEVQRARILKAVGATEAIFPERETAKRIAAQIINPNLLDFIPLAEDFEVMDVGVPDSFHGKNLKELKLRESFGVFVIAIKELIPTRFVFLPGPDFVVKPSDILVMIGRAADLGRIQEGAGE